MVQRPARVVVVGGGAAGVITAATLLREAGGTPLEVHVVERSGTVGPGLAYGTQEGLHLLNNYAGRMSAFEDDPGHLVRWCRAQDDIVSTDTFLPRRVYGEYLAHLLEEPLRQGCRMTRLRGEVVGVDDSGTDYSVTRSVRSAAQGFGAYADAASRTSGRSRGGGLPSASTTTSAASRSPEARVTE